MAKIGVAQTSARAKNPSLKAAAGSGETAPTWPAAAASLTFPEISCARQIARTAGAMRAHSLYPKELA